MNLLHVFVSLLYIKIIFKKCLGNEYPEPVLFLPLNKQYGTQDISKTYLTTTAVGITLSTGPAGKPDGSYDFQNGASSYIEIPQHSKTDTRYSITVTAWVYIQGIPGPILHYDTQNSLWGIHVFIVDSSKLFARPMKRYSSTLLNALAYAMSPINSWKYVGYTYDYNTGIQKLYVDDVEVKSLNVGKFEIATQYKIKIGGKKYGDSRSFKGKISCLQVYDKALTREQMMMAKTYCSRNELYRSCFHYQSIDEPSRVTEKKVSVQPSDKTSISRAHWYRLTGKRIVQSCPAAGSCGTQSPGWLNGQYPSKEDGIKKMEICYRDGSNCCASKGSVFVRQCHGYHVFKFDDFPADGRFCTEEDSNQYDDVVFMSTYGKCLSNHVFYTETEVTEATKCIGYCLSAGTNCKSVNYINEDNGKCQLNNATLTNGSARNDNKCTYYGMI